MRNITFAGIVAAVATLALMQTASAERVCRSVCDGGACVQKCTERDDTVVIERERRPPPPGVELRAPGVGIEIGR